MNFSIVEEKITEWCTKSFWISFFGDSDFILEILRVLVPFVWLYTVYIDAA